MAAILQFQHSNKADKPDFAPGHTATILLYTGVRFERIDFEALKAQSTQQHLAEPVRLAN
jgi:cytoplasmic iron level regulating protein YaaA (DUF328/UPF0246 family)